MARKKPVETNEDSAVDWAKDVQFVYANLGVPLSKRAAGSQARYRLHEWAGNPENESKFLSDLVPKSAAILEKRVVDDDAIVVAEKRSIAELREILRHAVSEIQSVQSEALNLEKIQENSSWIDPNNLGKNVVERKS